MKIVIGMIGIFVFAQKNGVVCRYGDEDLIVYSAWISSKFKASDEFERLSGVFLSLSRHIFLAFSSIKSVKFMMI